MLCCTRKLKGFRPTRSTHTRPSSSGDSPQAQLQPRVGTADDESPVTQGVCHGRRAHRTEEKTRPGHTGAFTARCSVTGHAYVSTGAHGV